MHVGIIAYICDGMACEGTPGWDKSCCELCCHTTNFEHALHKDANIADQSLFKRVRTGHGLVVNLWEIGDDYDSVYAQISDGNWPGQ